MRDCRTCAADQICHAGVVALDTSHVVYLARGALVLADGLEEAARCIAYALRATACWNIGRMWTTARMLNDQIEEQLGELNLTPPSPAGWSEYLLTYSPTTSLPVVAGDTGGRHDAELLRHVMENASREPTLLVTNDEDLFEATRRWLFNHHLGCLASETSTGMMLKLLHCGAVPEEFVDACLTAENSNLEHMRSTRGMSQAKYDRKRRRLERAMQQLALHRYDPDWAPDPSG